MPLGTDTASTALLTSPDEPTALLFAPSGEDRSDLTRALGALQMRVAIAADGVHTLEKGTPLVQVIPFHRTRTALPGRIKVESPVDAATRQRIFRNTLAADGWYRKFARTPR